MTSLRRFFVEGASVQMGALECLNDGWVEGG